MSVEKYVDGEKCVDLCCPIKDSREINLQAMLNLVAMSCDKKIEFDVGGRRYLIREVVAKGKVKSETKRKK